jgi:hypothetical protein
MKVACHISLERSRWVLQLFFWLHLNRSSAQKNYGPPKSWKSQFWEFWDSQLGNPGSIWHLDVTPWLIIDNIIRGRWWLPPTLGYGEFCEFVCAHGLFMHQKCSNYALTNFLFGLCKFVWIIDLLITCLSPHPKVLVYPSTFEVLQVKERTLIYFSFIAFTFGFAFEYNKDLGVCHNQSSIYFFLLSPHTIDPKTPK